MGLQKRLIVIVGFLCLTSWCSGQSVLQPILFSHIDTVYSQVLQEKRPVWIYCPPYDTTYFSKPQYPVLYVLDAEGYFSSLLTLLQQLSVVNGNTVLPEMIIVGIPNLPAKRITDLTPGSGASPNAFTLFMEKELIPYIDGHYATAPYRVLIGHSLGGLTVINTLLKHAALFSSYIALDPSMSYANADLLQQSRGLLKEQQFEYKTLFMGFANTMDPGMDTTQVRADTSGITLHIRSILKLKDNLQAAAVNGLKWNYKYYPDDDHASMPLAAGYDALRYIFRNNRFPRNQPQHQYFDKTCSVAQLKTMITTHYQLVSNEMGYTVRPSEALINQFAYIFLQQKDDDRARLFFELNIKYYPDNFNVYDGMGYYFMAINDKAEAVSYFKRALKLKNSAEIQRKLDKIQGEKR